MKKTILFIIFSLFALNVEATTYYVRTDGGTSTQCTGTTDAAYPGSGTGQACAYIHPAYAMGAGVAGSQTASKLVAGDTLMIGAGDYMIGYGMPNTAGCNASFPYSCVLRKLPSGASVNSPTKLLGYSYNTGAASKPTFWGTQSIWTVLDIGGLSNIEIQGIEITDHSTCTFRQGANQCSEVYPNAASTYGRNGIESRGATNVTIRNVDIMGMSRYGMLAGDFSGVTIIDRLNIFGSGFNGWDGDNVQIGGTGNFNFGTMFIDKSRISFSGCVQAYPHSASWTASDYSSCTDQNASGQGDGLAGGGTFGTLKITRSMFDHNVQDGVDFLHANGADSFYMDKSTVEGNIGNQIKYTAKNVDISNTIIIANCTYHIAAGKVNNTSTFSPCRANGTPISASTGAAGGTWKFTNITALTSTGNGSPFIEVVNGNGLCNGTETYTYKNNVLYRYNGPTNWTYYYSGLSGACQTAWAAASTTYSNVYNFQSSPAGTGNSSSNPLWSGSINPAASSNVSNITLTASSPGKGGGNTATYWNTSTDVNNFPQNSPIDMGAVQYGSSEQLAQAGQTCSANADCSSGNCSGFVCSGSCTANGGACASGATCCSGYCNGSSLCAVAPTCGDNVIQPGEVCDGTNMNGSNCILQGFTGGTLACASNCLSFNTASCTNTLVFPLTPIIDNFNRSNEGPPPSALWETTDFSVVSNKMSATGYGWADYSTPFNSDLEGYVTISTLEDITNARVTFYFWTSATDTGDYYAVRWLRNNPGTDVVYIRRYDNNVGTNIASFNQEYSAGSKLGFSAITNTITVYVDTGSGWTSLGNITDSTYTHSSGILSFEVFGSTATNTFDDFGGGSTNPITCGNGLKEGSEVCDGADLAGQSCLTQGYASGTLSCATNCQSFVTSSCVSASSCGNNTQETGEICDGTDLNSQTCVGLNYASGTLTCASDCQSFVTTGCVSVSSSAGGGVTFK